MKRLFILIILLLLLVSCTPIQAEPEPVIETVIVTETVIETVVEYVEVEDTSCQEEVEKYRSLVASLNDLLKNVYYGYASNDSYILDGFTAFSIDYRGEYYIVTAGHCIENKDGKFYNHKFKANYSKNWVYPKLIDYNSYGYEDYAIFYSNKVDSGFKTNSEYMVDVRFVLGSIDNGLNVFKELNFYKSEIVQGESGSPIININGEVIGLIATNIGGVDIDVVLDVIDSMQ